ncbi:MAG: hypothetical protein Q4B84_00085 [Clostridia bacterium]|nr:hypothetical protein [Clostridia bacterium]
MYKVILFFEFLKNNKEILKDVDINDLSLKNVEDNIVPLAKENGFEIKAKDIFRFFNEYSEYLENEASLIDDNNLEKIAGGMCNFNKVMATSFLSLTGLIGSIVNNQAYATSENENLSTIKKSSIKTVKSQIDNTLSDAEIKYYQGKIGEEYKFVSNKGMSGSFATAYKLEDKNGNEFVLKISNNPENSERWIQNQKNTNEKIKKYYKNYRGELKITNYTKFGDDFVIEEYLGERVNFNESYIKDNPEYFVNSMAEFFKYTHKCEKTAGMSINDALFKHIKLNDVYEYLDKAKALNEEDKKMLSKLITDFENRDKSDENICSLVHTDIRAQNIVYNPKTKKFALIDFDSLFVGAPIYLSFTSRTIGSCGIPFELISKTIDKYNEISDIKVKKEKVRELHKIGNLMELYMCSKYRDRNSNEYIRTYLWPNIKSRFLAIDKGFKN